MKLSLSSLSSLVSHMSLPYSMSKAAVSSEIPGPESPSLAELSLKTGTRQCPITGRCQTDAGERMMLREMHVAGLRWGREGPCLSDNLACFAPGEKGGLACLAAVAQVDRP